MILYTLRCASGHEFEAWFRDGDGFEAQQTAGEIACPLCGDAQVEKAVMAPRIGRSRGKTPALSPAQIRAASTARRPRKSRRSSPTRAFPSAAFPGFPRPTPRLVVSDRGPPARTRAG